MVCEMKRERDGGRDKERQREGGVEVVQVVVEVSSGWESTVQVEGESPETRDADGTSESRFNSHSSRQTLVARITTMKKVTVSDSVSVSVSGSEQRQGQERYGTVGSGGGGGCLRWWLW